MRLAVGCLLLALPALAQLDSSALRAKFGTPTVREIFHLRPGYDLSVDYGAKGQCALYMPPSITRGETERFLGELIPDSIRGKLGLSRTASSSQENQVYQRDYEHVTIAIHGGSQGDDGVSVFFNSEGCKR
jgi:hypothetical protein